jgi:hypothetical protein
VASSDCAEDIQYEMYAKRAGFTINSYRIGDNHAVEAEAVPLCNLYLRLRHDDCFVHLACSP